MRVITRLVLLLMWFAATGYGAETLWLDRADIIRP